MLALKNEELIKQIDEAQDESKSQKIFITKCHNDSINCTRRNHILQSKIKKLKQEKFCYNFVKQNKKMHHYYTGIKKETFSLIVRNSNLTVVCKKLTIEDHLLLILMKLRIGLTNRDLSYRFSITYTMTSKIFRSLIPVLAKFMLLNLFS